jgi:hypothetical protein
MVKRVRTVGMMQHIRLRQWLETIHTQTVLAHQHQPWECVKFTYTNSNQLPENHSPHQIIATRMPTPTTHTRANHNATKQLSRA